MALVAFLLAGGWVVVGGGGGDHSSRCAVRKQPGEGGEISPEAWE